MEHVSVQQESAGFASRTIAFVIDLILASAILLAIGLFVQLIATYFPVNKLLAQVLSPSAGEQARSPTALAVAIVVYAIYSIACWTLMGQTPGKALMGIRVVRTHGQPLSIGRSILRYLAYWVSALPLFLGFLWVLVDDDRRGWHDKIADTHVIYAPTSQFAVTLLQRFRQQRPAT